MKLIAVQLLGPEEDGVTRGEGSCRLTDVPLVRRQLPLDPLVTVFPLTSASGSGQQAVLFFLLPPGPERS